MKIFGYEKACVCNDKLLELTEITIQADSDKLRRIAQFVLETADILDKHGSKFGHEHLKDFFKGVDLEDPDIIISK
jgi:hypothetical protein